MPLLKSWVLLETHGLQHSEGHFSLTFVQQGSKLQAVNAKDDVKISTSPRFSQSCALVRSMMTWSVPEAHDPTLHSLRMTLPIALDLLKGPSHLTALG